LFFDDLAILYSHCPMTTVLDPEAWLEDADHKRIPIRGCCSIGRSPSNQVVLQNDEISRRHAVIQVQSELEYWLHDTFMPPETRPGDAGKRPNART
jgi:FHA domain-containing protein